MRISSLKSIIFINFLFLLLMQSCAFGQADSPKDSQVVCITRTGTKYHRCTCQYLRSSSSEITLAEARERDYDACSICKPDLQYKTMKGQTQPISPPTSLEPMPGNDAAAETDAAAPRVDDSAQKVNVSRQCSGFTKSGMRCKRKTTNANGRCYQHQS